MSADVSSVHKTRISLVDCLKRLLLLLVLSTFVPICCPTSLVFVRAPATLGVAVFAPEIWNLMWKCACISLCKCRFDWTSLQTTVLKFNFNLWESWIIHNSISQLHKFQYVSGTQQTQFVWNWFDTSVSCSNSKKINTLLLLSQGICYNQCSIRKDEVEDAILKHQSDFAISKICNGWWIIIKIIG